MITNKLSKQIIWVQLISSFIIVFDHCFDYINFESIKSTVLDNLVFVLTEAIRVGATRIAMASFFAISGFLLFKNLGKFLNLDKGVFKWYKQILGKRLRTLVIPYLFFNLVWTLFFSLLSLMNFSDDFYFSVNNVLAGVFLGKYNEVFWYIKVLIFFIVISPLIAYSYKFLNKWLLLLLITIYSILEIPSSLGIISLSNNFNGFFYFVLGGYFAFNKDSKLGIKISYFWLPISVFIIYYLSDYRVIDSKLSLPLNLVLLLFSLIGLLSYLKLTEGLVSFKLPYISQFTFIIYALHKPILQALNKILAKLFAPNLFVYLINNYVLPLVTIFFIYIIICLFDKFCKKLLLLLNGFRKWEGYE